ncbi:MAG: hypothetical protein J6Q41_06115 [Firmicutes bacterium]|nr:hypothetical protein [Bacillota bacterium]
MSIRQLSVFVQNEAGKLQEITDCLYASDIDIRALSVAETQDFGIFRLIVDDIDKAVSALQNEGHIVKITDVIGCKLEDRPGGLARIVKVISAIGVNMEYMYAFLTKSDSAYLVIRVEDNDAVEAALRARDITLLEESDVTAL